MRRPVISEPQSGAKVARRALTRPTALGRLISRIQAKLRAWTSGRLDLKLASENAIALHTGDQGQTDHGALLRLQQRLSHCHDLADLLTSIGRELPEILQVRDRVSLAFLEPGAQQLRVYRLLPAMDAQPDELPRVRVEGTVVGDVARDGRPRVVGDVRTDDNIRFGRASHDGIRSTASVPVVVAGRLVGVLNVGSRSVGACHDGLIEGLRQVATIVGSAVYTAETGVAWRRLHEHLWPSNVGALDLVAKVPATPAPSADHDWPTRDEHERRYLRRVLEHTGGRIEGPRGAARILGLLPSTLRSRMKRLGVAAQNLPAPSESKPGRN